MGMLLGYSLLAARVPLLVLQEEQYQAPVHHFQVGSSEERRRGTQKHHINITTLTLMLLSTIHGTEENLPCQRVAPLRPPPPPLP
jgi:hypothetical protein